jgi:sensor c-di-GMP phosphodiesterase-like protein
MKIMKKWQKIIDELDFAYQPIISFDTGKVIGNVQIHSSRYIIN